MCALPMTSPRASTTLLYPWPQTAEGSARGVGGSTCARLGCCMCRVPQDESCRVERLHLARRGYRILSGPIAASGRQHQRHAPLVPGPCCDKSCAPPRRSSTPRKQQFDEPGAHAQGEEGRPTTDERERARERASGRDNGGAARCAHNNGSCRQDPMSLRPSSA